MKTIYLIAFISLLCTQGVCQTHSYSGFNKDGKVTVTIAPVAKQVIENYALNMAAQKMIGFRIQLCSESGNQARTYANNQKRTFLQLYPNINAYMVWESPNFKVKVGNFTNRLDAICFWKEIQTYFPQSFVVSEEITMIKTN